MSNVPLKDRTDEQLISMWVNADDRAEFYAIIEEMRLRRKARRESEFSYPPDRFPI